MYNQFKNQFTELEKLKSDVLVLLKNSSEEKINLKVAAGKWSASQIAGHLILGEEMTAAYLKLKIQKRDKLYKSGIKEQLRSAILNLALRSPLKFKAPEFTTRVPEYSRYSEIEKRWTDARTDFRTILENFPPDLLDQTVFKHPVAGRINIFQTLSFMENHIIHHLPQIKGRLNG
jgi:hypothetical protein